MKTEEKYLHLVMCVETLMKTKGKLSRFPTSTEMNYLNV